MREGLIGDILTALKVSRDSRQEWRDRIGFQVDGAKGRISFDRKLPKPGAIKRKAAQLRATLKKAKNLSEEIEPVLSAMLFELADGEIGRNYETYESILQAAIRATDIIEKQIIVPPGAKARDRAKFEATRIALELVGQLGDTDDKPLVNEIASRLYELVTGQPDVELVERLDAYAPPVLKLRKPTPKK